jgi:hypothetical protein
MFQTARFLCLLFVTVLFVTSSLGTKAQFPPPPPLSFVQQQDGWTLYSRKVNIPLCAAEPTDHSGETWLGTALGIKRLAKDGTLLRLYTRSDGLPSDVVTALAVEPDEAWAIAPIGSGHYDLCRLDRKADNWESLREITVTLPNYSDWTDVPDFIATGSGRFVCFVIGNAALMDPGETLYLYDRHGHIWKDVPHRFAANWLYAQTGADGANNVFIATDGGLLRYQIENGEWQTYFTERAVVGGTAETDGSLWLATLTASDKRPVPSHVQLHLTRFDPQHQEVVSDSAFPQPAQKPDTRPSQHPTIPQRELDFPGPQRSVVEADGGVWLVEHRKFGFFNSSSTLPLTAMRYDVDAATWSQPNLIGSDDIPPAVAAAARLADYPLPDNIMTRFLPGWISPIANLPPEASPSTPAFPQKVVRGVLTYGSTENFPAKTVSLPSQEVLLTPTVFSVRVVGDTLYALTGAALWSQSLHGGKWTEYHLPVPIGTFRTVIHPSYFPSDGYLWVNLQEGRLWAFDPKTGSWAKTLQVDSEKTLIGAEYGNAWFTSQYSGGLTRVSLLGAPSEDVRVELPPHPQTLSALQYIDPLTNQIVRNPLTSQFVRNPFGLPTLKYYMGTPLRIALGKAWYATSPYSAAKSSTVRGYDLTTHLWTEPLHIAGRIDGFAFCATSHELYVSFGGRDIGIGVNIHQLAAGALYRFRSDTQQWENVAPACSQWQGSNTTPVIISVDAQAIWLFDSGRHLWRWDRKERTWSSYSSETVFSPVSSFGDSQPSASAAYQGNCIYLSSPHGLQRFNVSSKAWTTLPFPENASDFQARSHTQDNHAVWAVCGDGAGGSCIARYDLSTRKWMFFTPPQSPSRVDYFLRIVSEGDTGMLLEGPFTSRLYKLDPHTGRTQDLMPSLLNTVAPGENHVSASVERVVVDGNDIWALVTVRSSTLPLTIHPFTTLVRWNAQQGFTARRVPEDAALTRESFYLKGDILVQPHQLLLLLPGGIVRFLESSNSCQSFVPPVGFPTPLGANTGIMIPGPDGSLWLMGQDTVMHWTEP